MKAILVINSGSSTIKFSVFNSALEKKYHGFVDHIQSKPHVIISAENHDEELSINIPIRKKDDPYKKVLIFIIDWVKEKGFDLIGAGHRIVHGGDLYNKSVLIDDQVIEQLEKLIPLAPLHQPFNLKAVHLLQDTYKNLKQIACFDTAFHSTCYPLSQLYALPEDLVKKGIRRYGFHGLSYEYIASHPLLKEFSEKKVIVAHLGNGATLCALKNLKSFATSIGFSTCDGLPMSTRSGMLDPNVVIYLQQTLKWSIKRIQKLLYKESGLLGVSKISSDMRTLLKSSDPKAKLAIDLFVYRIVYFIGALAAELQGLDAIVFTAGIGQHSAEIRKRVCERLTWLGAMLDDDQNTFSHQKAVSIHHKQSKLSLFVIPTDEESMIARHVQECM